MLLVGDSVGMYIGPQRSLQCHCPFPVTIFAVDKELRYIRATQTFIAEFKGQDTSS